MEIGSHSPILFFDKMFYSILFPVSSNTYTLVMLIVFFAGQRPVNVTLPVIGPKCGQIYRGKFKM